MKTLLWIGSPFFSPDLQDLLVRGCLKPLWGSRDWRVIYHLAPQNTLFTWQDCVRLANGEPHALVVGDNSRPPFVLGVEQFPCPTIFYAVDSHIHSWMPWYAQAFDVCLVSLRDHLPLFQDKRLPKNHVWWSPPYAPNLPDAPLFPDQPRQWKALFVGTVDPVKTPLRVRFMERLQKLVPDLIAMRGDYRVLYPQSRISLNFCERGDLNFRVFESMGCGTALLTPDVGHGLTDLFQPEKHLALYRGLPPAFATDDTPAGDEPEQAAERAAIALKSLLADEAHCRTLARNGWDEINRAHRARHRATAFWERLRSLPANTVKQRCHEADNIRQSFLKLIYLHWCECLPEGPLQEAYIRASRGDWHIEKGTVFHPQSPQPPDSAADGQGT